MVYVTIDLVRKKAEHHDGELAPLVEISLHQEGIEKIEYLQNWCPKLQILLLQSNLISKIENLNKLKELQYLNLAINNIEVIENLERCEALEKLDLTLNFIGKLTSIEILKDMYNLKTLFLTGNPCTDYPGYREYVVAMLPQLENLDCAQIKISERIIAMQNFDINTKEIIRQEEIYAKKREIQKLRVNEKIKLMNDALNDNIDDEESNKRFWNEKCEHCPEIRIEIEKKNQMRRKQIPEDTPKKRRERPLFTTDGRPFNINEMKINFKFNDDNPRRYELDLPLYKHLDTSLIDVDVQPFYVRVTVKGKIFQIGLPEEINAEKSRATRSTTTGNLNITLLKMGDAINLTDEEYTTIKADEKFQLSAEHTSTNGKQNKREFLEIGSSIEVLDFTKMIKPPIIQSTISSIKAKVPPKDFQDDPDVPPLL